MLFQKKHGRRPYFLEINFTATRLFYEKQFYIDISGMSGKVAPKKRDRKGRYLRQLPHLPHPLSTTVLWPFI